MRCALRGDSKASLKSVSIKLQRTTAFKYYCYLESIEPRNLLSILLKCILTK